MKRVLLLINVGLMALFGVSSGIFKLLGGQADIDVFAHLGMSPTAIAVFGVVQAVAGVTTAIPTTRRAGGALLTVCNAFATAGLFAAGVQPFGVVSMLFIAMAALVALVRVPPRA